MKNFAAPIPVRAKNPKDLYVNVMKHLETGLYDLHAPTAVLGGELVTWVAEYPASCVYVLVHQETLEDYFREVTQLSEKGYDQVFAAFEFDGWICQWMAKEKYGSSLVSLGLTSEAVSTPMPGYRLVESVQVLGGLSSVSFLHPYGYKPGSVR